MVQPVFVVGYMHSGTTLVRRILSRSVEALTVTDETRFFDPTGTHRYECAAALADGRLEDAIRDMIEVVVHRWQVEGCSDSDVEGVAQGAPDLAAEIRASARALSPGHVLSAVLGRLASAAGRTFWVEKTPSHVYFLKEILAEIPDARVVEIVRDPRDVVASRKTRRSTVWAPDRYRPEVRHMKHLLVAHHPVWDSLAWKAAVSATSALAPSGADQVLRVRYEDLVSRPAQEVASICTFLGMRFTPEMTAVSERNPADHRAEQGGSITAASMSRWKSVLTPAEVLVVQTLTRPQMLGLGYPAAPVTSRARGHAVLIWCSALFEAMRRLDRRRRARGGRFVVRQVRGYVRRGLLLLTVVGARGHGEPPRSETRNQGEVSGSIRG